MIHRIYRLVDTKHIEVVQRELLVPEENVVIRPDYCAICAADMRYYFGLRSREILRKKLPMALIHEAVGTVVFDPKGVIRAGTKVVLVPNLDIKSKIGEENVKANYRSNSVFLSSDTDGFLQDLVSLSRNSFVFVPEEKEQADMDLYVLCEILSVVFNALDSLNKVNKQYPKKIGIWGDGTVGYIMSLVLKYVFPEAHITVVGKGMRKLQFFSFVNQTFTVDRLPENFCVDFAFECVGGTEATDAINQIIEVIRPQGIISLLGVSEHPVLVNTRVLLEKGLIMVGNSRSEKVDFEKAVQLLFKYKEVKKYLRAIISETIDVKDEKDIEYAFERAQNNNFKTLINWKV